jgi:sigma-B regulation protein RsbU (phosphoserine phosphatase)
MNRELIQEMGSIDNYLTGILLRFAGDKAEYVNAGHTDLIMKNGKTGEARIVTSGNERFRGHFLGVDSMDELYAMLRFSVREGDSLLLYTDCLIESRNKGGEQYGLDRLLRAFSAVDVRQGAQEQLDHLMADLHRHAGTHSLGDDLTAIILKKSV